ncbi:glycosyltransferase family 4 protein [Thalassospiraceae bacterium LMO-SO8]|nr:glycosyltransferase family 4 protein [Alphaproteobacteria bacterium LMO-S08]WND77614.1 glycosyltransferase family 4 protein [Thalassospiraceae bacterium LMO-SO8]
MPDMRPQRPRLLFIVTEDWAFLRHRLPMARAAMDMGFEVAVATRVSGHADAIRALGITVFHTPVERAGLSPIGDLRYLAALICTLRRFRPHLIHNVAAKPILYGTLAARIAARGAAVLNAFTGLGILFTDGDGGRSLKSRVLGGVLMAMLRRLCGHTQVHMLVQNADDRDFLTARGIGRDGHMHLIPGSGVDLAQFPVTPEPRSTPLRAVLVGRLLKTKGVEDFVQAARILKDRGRDIRMVLIGAPDPGNPTTVTREQIDAWVAEGLVEWTGERDDIAAVWASAHIAVLPSYREGLPKSLLEAAACARPLVAADVPGCRALVRDGENGLLVPPRDPAALADAIDRLAADGALRRAFGAAARADVEARLSQERIADAVRTLYRRLMNDTGA